MAKEPRVEKVNFWYKYKSPRQDRRVVVDGQFVEQGPVILPPTEEEINGQGTVAKTDGPTPSAGTDAGAGAVGTESEVPVAGLGETESVQAGPDVVPVEPVQETGEVDGGKAGVERGEGTPVETSGEVPAEVVDPTNLNSAEEDDLRKAFKFLKP